MADAAALTAIAKSALQLFTSLAKDELLLLWHSGENLQKLKDTIDAIICFLQDAEERGSKDLAVQHFLSKLRKVMYDTEDLFDALAYHVLHKKTKTGNAFTKEVSLFFSKSNQLGFIVKTAHEVKSLRERLDEIAKNMQQFSFIQQPARPLHQSFTREKTHSFVHEEDVIGRDRDRDLIINMLIPKDKGETSHDPRLSVVAIIGFGGLGKTTVAQLVFNDKKVKDYFNVHMWACINDLSDLKQVLIEVIASKEEGHRDFGLEKLQEKLRGLIDGRKFLIVLDDIWDESARNWQNLEKILRCGGNGSKVLVTTRSIKVAESLDALKPYCQLGVLSNKSAWHLFQKKVFIEGENHHKSKLKKLGKQIVKKCENVPLAIVAVGSLLRQEKREVKVWSEFLFNKLKDVLTNTDDKTHGSIKGVLKVSYDDLLPDLKLCFSSLSLFPKDHVFDKDELVRLWISQRFIKPTSNNKESLEELGETYFFELAERCFFQEVKYKGWGNYTFKMHALLHDLAVDTAKTEILFLDEVPRYRVGIDGLRHISMGYEVGDSFDYCSLASHPQTVRTLLFQRRAKLSKRSLDKLLTSFRMLSTLGLRNLGIVYISDSIGELIHLRYLDLSKNKKLKHLPKSICKLHHLMFFVLRGCRLLEKLPPNIEKLVSLRQLYIEGCDSLDSLPSGLEALTLLVNLDRVIVHRANGGLRYLNELDNLCGSVQIELPKEGWPNAVEDARKANMWKKDKLKGMVIECKGSSTAASNSLKLGKDEARAVMDAFELHENLEYLKIRHYGGEMFSDWLCTLKNVTELCLSYCDQVEYLENEINSNVCFPYLKTLTLERMRHLKGWWRQEVEETQRPRLPNVSEVRVSHCLELKGQMPLMDGIESLHLHKVDMKLVNEIFSPVNQNCSSLSSFYLRGVEGLISLPKECIRHLIALQRLEIQQCKELRWVSARELAHLTALKHLRISSGDIGDEDEVAAGTPWKALQGIEYLEVAVGSKHLAEELQYLTRLQCLKVLRWKKIEEDGVQLQLKGLQNLRQLNIGFDRKTGHLPKAGIKYLHSLRTLMISNCKELYLDWKTLVNMNLDYLSLENVARVTEVEDDDMMTAVEQRSRLGSLNITLGVTCNLEEVNWVDDIPWTYLNSSLQWLCFEGMREWEQLPDGIQHLTSLTTLLVKRCKKVRSLPNWIPQLTSLTSLQITKCSDDLERRCERERGEDWHLIRHLPKTCITTKRWRRNLDASRDKEEEEEEGGSWWRKKGCCGGLTLSKCNPKFYCT